MSQATRWTQQQYDEYLRRTGQTPPSAVSTLGSIQKPGNPNPCAKKQASVKPRRSQEPNKTETEYSAMLKRAHPDAQIKWEAYTLRLADRTRYTPDFSVVFPDGRLEFHEVKGGFIYPKALIKPKIAASMFPHRFVLAQKTKENGWQINDIPKALI